MSRRQLFVYVSAVLLSVLLNAPAAAQAAQRPNIIWLVLDDASPALGSYGDPQAITPNMDRLAREGARFTRAFTHTPVCAPSRFGLVTGIYPTTAGAHHMRSLLINPPTTFMHLLRASGYFVAWPGKVDFNFDPGGLSALPEGAADSTAPWRDGPSPKQPFFAYLNLGVMHEAQVRGVAQLHAKNTARLKPSEFHEPAKMHVPAFLPDAPEVRKDLAQFYDLMTAGDYTVGDVLEWLDRNGLTDNTIVFVFGDHGTGMPRSKRWVYDSGIKVPLMIRWPGHIAPNSVRDDLVSFIDFAPTVLSLAGVDVPRTMQGQVFLGDKRAKEREYIFATRDRMDETFDRIRGVRDKRLKYIRNFHPELPYAQVNAYNEQNPTMRVWRQLHAEGKLTGAAEAFFAPTKPREELYDTDRGPRRGPQSRVRPEVQEDCRAHARRPRQVDQGHEGPGRGARRGARKARHSSTPRRFLIATQDGSDGAIASHLHNFFIIGCDTAQSWPFPPAVRPC